MMSESLAGKVAMVTGAARGIGRACALKLAGLGADLVVNDCSHAEELTTLVRAIKDMGRRAVGIFANIGSVVECELLFQTASQHFERIDILVNNAAWSVRKSFLDVEFGEMQQTLAVTLLGTMYCSQLAARIMQSQGGGAIVMISSVHGERPYINAAAYNAAKAGVDHLVASLALELCPSHIRVNGVAPGWIDTPGERMHNTEAQIQERAKALPMERLGKPEEVADAVAFLCSDQACYMTGSMLRVDGGFSLRF